MTIGIVSLWHNHPELLPFFQHMMRVDGWDKLVLVDNASDEGLAEMYLGTLMDIEPGVCSYYRTDDNNVVKAWNLGVKRLDTDILIVMANDLIMLDARWVQIVTDGMRPGRFQGPFPMLAAGQYYMDGSMTVWMREDWEKLGGLDEEYQHPGYWSDVDICYRAMKAGMEMRSTWRPVHHLTNWTVRDFQDTVFLQNSIEHNQARFIAKRGS
jgi:glycosyltransferase involved in cell wall biosynthesis